MGAFNTVLIPWKNPTTGEAVNIKVQFKYGDTWQYEYGIGDELRWGGNDIGRQDAKRVVVDGSRESDPPLPGVPDDFEVHILNGRIEKVIPSTGNFDFVRAKETYIVLE
jgi:hypothetical protein